MAYPGGVSKNELETRIKRLQGEVNRLLVQRAEGAARQVVVQMAAQALDSVTWDGVSGKPTTFPPSAHTHVESDITDLDKYTQAEVDAMFDEMDGGTATSF